MDGEMHILYFMTIDGWMTELWIEEGARYFTKIDLKSGYHQVQVVEGVVRPR